MRFLRLPLTPQVASFNDFPVDPSGWSLQDIRAPSVNLLWLTQFDITLDPAIWFSVPMPESGKIRRVTAHVKGQSLWPLPASMPSLALIQMPMSGENYTSYEQLDLTTDPGAYGDPHVIALTQETFGGVSLPITTDATYWIRVVGESGAEARNNRLKLLAVNLTIDP